VEEWLQREMGVKVNVKETLLAKIESWEQKKNIMLNKSTLKERKGDRIYIEDDLTNEERKTQKKLREVAREERDRGKRMKNINKRGIVKWDEREEKLKKII
jgi:hypothetical protein